MPKKLHMIKRPLKFPNWATKSTQMSEPPPNVQSHGWFPEEPVVAQWLNYLLFTVNKWLKYLDDQRGRAKIFKNKGSLPKATEHKGLIVLVEDTKTVAISNGLVWKKITTEEF